MLPEIALLIAHAVIKPAPLKMPPAERPTHHFYDRTAKIELGAAVALDAYDNAQTCRTLSVTGPKYIISGNMFLDIGPTKGHESGLPTQSCAGATALLTAQLAGQELVAYLLHRTNHHKIEKFVRFFSIEGNTQGIIQSALHGGGKL